ncbi:MAG: LamG domain-containing protein [Akkermansiaceae bacterium]
MTNKAHPSIIGAVALAAALPAATQGALVSHYTLDDTSSGIAVDSVNGNNAVWQNGTNTNLANVAGQIGGAADLTDAGGAAANNFFQLNLPQLVGANGISISLWINNRNQTSSGYNGIFMTRTFNGATNNSWGLAIENNGNERFDARVNGPGIDSADGLLTDDGNWKHLTLVWDGVAQTATQYINGVETATGASIAGPIAGPDSGPWYIGYDDCCGNTRDFDGAIDDIMVFDNALSAAEVDGIYQAGIVPEPSTSLLGLLSGLFLLRRRR